MIKFETEKEVNFFARQIDQQWLFFERGNSINNPVVYDLTIDNLKELMSSKIIEVYGGTEPPFPVLVNVLESSWYVERLKPD